MVLLKTPKSWLSDHHLLAGATVGILAFEAAAAMSRLVSLHRSLADPEISRLRAEDMRSPGVAYLTSTDQHFLLRLACADLLSALDAAAETISRLASRCRAATHLSFPRIYADVKAGSANTAVRAFSVRGVERRVRQMEKSIAGVARLFQEMDALVDMEAEEKKMALKFGRHGRPLFPPVKPLTLDVELLQADIRAQRKRVERVKEETLWSKTFDEAVALMSRAVLAVFARICAVFGPFVQGLPPVLVSGGRMTFNPIRHKFRIYPRLPGRHYSSGPMDRPEAGKEAVIRNSCPIIGARGREAGLQLPQDSKKVLQPPSSTVGGSGLAMCYANVIVSAKRLMLIRTGEEAAEKGEEVAAREEIYRLLPAGLQTAVRGKLRERWRERGAADGGLVVGWQEAVERILKWLGPVAMDTVQWQEERTMDRRQRLSTQPRVLALQTLQFSDREKAEAAIAEVLVGLSCICWHDGNHCGPSKRRT